MYNCLGQIFVLEAPKSNISIVFCYHCLKGVRFPVGFLYIMTGTLTKFPSYIFYLQETLRRS